MASVCSVQYIICNTEIIFDYIIFSETRIQSYISVVKFVQKHVCSIVLSAIISKSGNYIFNIFVRQLQVRWKHTNIEEKLWKNSIEVGRRLEKAREKLNQKFYLPEIRARKFVRKLQLLEEKIRYLLIYLFTHATNRSNY